MPTEISGSTGVNKIQDGTVVNADIDTLDASKLTGTVADARISALTASKLTGSLPAISGASLTGLTSSQMPAGSVVQYGTHHNGDYLNLDTTAWVDTGVSLSFTPLLSSSKLICTGIWSISAYSTSSYHGEVLYKIQVDGTDIHQEQDVYSPFPSNRMTVQLPQMAVYTNSDTNAKTIKLVIKNPDTGHNVRLNQYTGYSSLLVMEVAA